MSDQAIADWRRVQPSWPRGVVSFTFDDFPKSAWAEGGAILERHGARGTYYVASANLGKVSKTLGPLANADDIRAVHARGHEIAGHTHTHPNLANAAEPVISSEAAQNAAVLAEILDGYRAGSFAYPYGGTSDLARQVLGALYSSCRGTKSGINHGSIDAGELRSNPIYSRLFDEARLKALIDKNRALGGWLIFYTHDVAASPSPSGCRPTELEALVAHAAASSRIMSVRDVVESWKQSAAQKPDNAAGSPRADIPDMAWMDGELPDILAENQRLHAFSEAQRKIYELQSRNAVNARLGDVLIRGAKGRASLLSVPVNLGKIWRETGRRTPPGSVGGKGFDKLILAYRDGGFVAVEKLMDEASLAPVVRADGYKALATHLRDSGGAEASEAARRAYALNPTTHRLKWLVFRLHEAGEVTEAEALFEILPTDAPLTDSERHQAERLRAEARQARLRDAKEKSQFSARRADIERYLSEVTAQRDAAAKLVNERDREIEALRQAKAAQDREIEALRQGKAKPAPAATTQPETAKSAEAPDRAIAILRHERGNVFRLLRSDGTMVENPRIDGLDVDFKGRDAWVEIEEGSVFRDVKIIVGYEASITIKKTHQKGIKNMIIDTLCPCRGKTVFIDEGVSVEGARVRMVDDANLTLRIGKHCMLSSNIFFRSADGHTIFDVESGAALNPSHPIIIGDHVWVGAGVTFLKGTSIPNNVIVGANALVSKAFDEEFVIVAGMPAKIIKRGVNWTRERIPEYQQRIGQKD